jgi:uncharacterized protein YbjT (DUF2867 family)
MRNALIAGATGLVGKQLLSMLLNSNDYKKVYVLSRRPLAEEHPKLEEIIIDFDRLPEQQLPEVNDVFCCLGTTMKKAGSKEAFRKVDFVYPYELAQKALQTAAEQYLLVSAMGANRRSFFFYNRVKGEVEENISKLIGYKSIHIFRPSLLLGKREEERFGEIFAQKLMRFIKPLMVGPLRKYRGIHARTVANGMLKAAEQHPRGIHIYESEEIKQLAGELTLSSKG